MPRPKGSKNKPKTTAAAVNYEALMEEKRAEKQAVEQEVSSLNADVDALKEQIAALKEQIKEKNAAIKAIDREYDRLEAKKEQEEAAAAEQAKKAELDAVLKKLMSEGVSASEILEKLK